MSIIEEYEQDTLVTYTGSKKKVRGSSSRF